MGPILYPQHMKYNDILIDLSYEFEWQLHTVMSPGKYKKVFDQFGPSIRHTFRSLDLPKIDTIGSTLMEAYKRKNHVRR